MLIIRFVKYETHIIVSIIVILYYVRIRIKQPGAPELPVSRAEVYIIVYNMT